MSAEENSTTSAAEGACTSATVPIIEAVRKTVLGRSERDEAEIIEYFEWQSNKTDDHEPIRVLHLEKMKTEVVLGRKHVVWDVHATDGRWWVITNPTNLYSQFEFPSLDYLISFHVGLMARITSREARKAGASNQRRFGAAWRRWEQAAAAMDGAAEAEDFQAIGMKCRECLLAFVRTAPEYVEFPDGAPIPKRGDFTQWADLIAEWAAPGKHAKDIRSHIKQVSGSAWQLANWLTHASNAIAIDAQITLDATQFVLGALSAAVIRRESAQPERCPECNSYQLSSYYVPELGIEPPYVTVCQACEWESVQPPDEDEAQQELPL